MQRQILVNGHAIHVTFEAQSVHISNNESLWNLLNEDTEISTDALVAAIKKTYESLYGKALDISDDSLCVEIWGHVYFEYFAIILEKMVSLHLIKELTNKISSYCKIIDSGESGKDNNRFFWDMLAPFKKQIALLLPEHIATENFKRDTL